MMARKLIRFVKQITQTVSTFFTSVLETKNIHYKSWEENRDKIRSNFQPRGDDHTSWYNLWYKTAQYVTPYHFLGFPSDATTEIARLTN